MIVVSSAYSVQVQPALHRVVSNTFPVQVLNALRSVTSNTFVATIQVPAGKQVIELTSLSSDSPLFGVAEVGDEWLLDLVTDGGLAITPLFNGTYIIDDLPGNGSQVFTYHYLDTSNAFLKSSEYVEDIDPVLIPSVVSNTFSITALPPAGMAAIVPTSIASGSPIEGYLEVGDEWVYETTTDGGVSITAALDGTYSNPDITGLGNQTFTWFGLDTSNSFANLGSHLETIVDPDTLPIAPSISVHPTNQTLNEGFGSVTFSATASGRPDPVYQWKLNGVSIPGATESSLEIFGSTVSTSNDGDVYTVTASNLAGSVTSSGASLSVLELPAAPVITLHPADQTLEEGSGSVTYTCAAISLNALTYQWEVYNGVQYVDILGATSPSLTVYGNTVTHELNDGNGYRCQISNSEGVIYTNVAALFVTAVVDEAPNATLTASDIDDSSFNVRFTADESGIFTMVVVTNNSTTPTPAQVKTATAPGILYVSPSTIMSAGIEVITPVTGLNVFTAYDVYAVLTDSEGNERLLDKLDVSTTRDSTPPVIQLIGSSRMRIPLGQAYSEQGATLVDNVDADRPASVTGAVSTGNVGTYTRTYTGADTEGNVAIPVTRTIIVYDPLLAPDDGGVTTNIVDETVQDTIDDVIE